jgi:hypothetical protein
MRSKDKQNLLGILEIVRKEICLILKDQGEVL